MTEDRNDEEARDVSELPTDVTPSELADGTSYREEAAESGSASSSDIADGSSYRGARDDTA
jgi:hypothetical protein